MTSSTTIKKPADMSDKEWQIYQDRLKAKTTKVATPTTAKTTTPTASPVNAWAAKGSAVSTSAMPTTPTTAMDKIKTLASTPTQQSWTNPTTGSKVTRPSDMSDNEWNQYIQKLQGVGTSATQNKIVNTQNTQANEMAAAGSQEERDAIYAKNAEARKQSMLNSISQNPNVSPEYISLFERKWNPITQKMEGVTDAEWAAIPDRFKRDLDAEQEIAEEFGDTGTNGQKYMAAYDPERLTSLIETGQVDPSEFTAQELLELGFDAARLTQLRDAGIVSPEVFDRLMGDLQGAGADFAIAEANLGATQAPTNQMMGVLQEALNAKNNFQNQKLGVSDLFTQAGLSGYEVLAQSLGQRSKEMDQKYQSAASVIGETGGAMSQIYNDMAAYYKQTKDDFNKQMDRLLEIDKEAQEAERVMEKLAVQHQNDIELEELKYGLKVKLLEKETLVNPTTTENAGDINIYDENMGVVDPKTGETREIGDGETKVGGKVYDKGAIAKIFNVGGIASWCGNFASTLSTAARVPDSWEGKKAMITHRDNPKAGEKMVLALGVPTDREGNIAGSGYGHVATILDYNPENGNIWVAESNRDGRMNRGASSSKVTFGVYNLNELKKRYGDNYGFIQGEFKPDIKAALEKAGPMEVSPLLGAVGKVVTGNAAGGLTDILKTFGMVSEGKSGSSTKSSDPAGGSGSIAQRYANITGKQGVLITNKDGTPTYKEGKELQAALKGKSPQEIEEYFTKLEEETSGGEENDPLVAELKGIAKEYLAEGDDYNTVYLILQEVYGTDLAKKALKGL